MNDLLLFVVLGLGTGSVYAGLGLSLVTVFKASATINFAVGGIAMWAAYVFDEVRRGGDLVLPVIGLPHRVHVGTAVGLAPAIALGVLSAVALVALAHLVVFHPLRHAPALARLVASVGLLLVLQALVIVRFGTPARTVAAIMPRESLTVSGVNLPGDRLLLAALAVAAALATGAFFRRTRIGLAIRAAAESEKGAILVGLSPASSALAGWIISGVLCGVFGILLSPVIGLQPAGYTLLVIPALAAAIVGRLDSLVLTAFAGLLLGVAQSMMQYLQTFTWYPSWATTGMREAVPFVAIVVTLVLAGDRLPLRSTVAEVTAPAAPMPAYALASPGIVAVAGGVGLVALQGSYRYALIVSLMWAIVMLSLVVLTGFVGQISLAQAALAGSAGFVLSKVAVGFGVPFPLAPMLAVAAATGVGILVGLPALRIRGTQLAIVSIAAGVTVEHLLLANRELLDERGVANVPPPIIGGVDLGILGPGFPRLIFGFLVLLVLVAACAMVVNLRRSPTGKQFLAVRSNERAAAATGIDVARTKLVAFGVSALLAAVGGVVLSYARGQISAAGFGVFTSLAIIAVCYVGGITSVGGAVIAGLMMNGGLIYVTIQRSGNIADHHLLVSGLALIVVTVVQPEGIAAGGRTLWASVRSRVPGGVSATEGNA